MGISPSSVLGGSAAWPVGDDCMAMQINLNLHADNFRKAPDVLIPYHRHAYCVRTRTKFSTLDLVPQPRYGNLNYQLVI